MEITEAKQGAVAKGNEASMLRQLQRIGQVNVARAAGVSEASITRWKDGELSRMSIALAAMGLKVVPVENKCFQPEYIDALRMLARQALDEPAQVLEWDR